MAGRSLNQLLAPSVCLVDHRYFEGTLVDWSGNANNGVWGAAYPVLSRSIGQVVGLSYSTVADVITIASLTIGQEFALEFMVWLRDEGVGIADGKLFSSAGGDIELGFSAANTLRFACGANLDTTLTPPRTVHIIATRDSSNDGFVYFDGVLANTGAVGANTETTSVMNIGNLDALNRGADGWFYLMRVFDTTIDNDETALLFESSRIKLWPGAPKRSGIMTPVGG